MTHSQLQLFLEKSLKRSFEITPLAGDASRKKFFRVTTEDKSFVLMETPNLTESKAWSRAQKTLDYFSVRTPSIKNHEETLFLLEDLGDGLLQNDYNQASTQDGAVTFYNKAIQVLSHIHQKTFRKKMAHKYSPEETPEFTPACFLRELDLFQQHMEIFLEKSLSASDKEIFKSQCEILCQKLFIQPLSLQHRDVHSKNILIHNDDIAFIDFQDLRWGPPIYDLVSLTLDSYVNLPPFLVTTLWKDFYKSSPLRKRLEFSKFERLCHIQSVQRSLKACSSFMKIYNDQGKTTHLKYLETCYHIALESLRQLPRFEALYKIVYPLSHRIGETALSKL